MSGEAAGIDPTTGAGLATAIATAAIAIDRFATGRWNRRHADSEVIADQIKSVVEHALALAEERRAGEHDCHDQLAALRTEMQVQVAALKLKVDECERKHAEVAERLDGGGFPPQHGGVPDGV